MRIHIKIVPGDYAPLMARVLQHLEEAKAHAANPEQEVRLHVCTYVCV